jgi:hypothetical protein
MAKEQEPLRIRYEYQKMPDSRLEYAHGIWGGINPQGEIEMNFYLESDKLPEYTEHIVAPDGSLGHEVSVPSPDDPVKIIVRRVHSQVVFNYQTARAIFEWLEEKIELLEQEEPTAVHFADEAMEQ